MDSNRSKNFIEKYESLRIRAISSSRHCQELILFMDRGMAAWIISWQDYAHRAGTRIIGKENVGEPSLNQEVMQPVIMLIADMVIGSVLASSHATQIR